MTPQDFETYRKENKLTRQAIAEMIGIPYMTYYKFVKNNSKPHLKTWRKLEKFYKEKIEKKEISITEYFKEYHEPTPVKIEHSPKTQVVYLESVEELLGELLNGGEVHIKSPTGHTLKLVDGFIVRYSSGDPISINAPILCSERYYAIKPIPLNLEIGKRYIARDGRICTIFNENEGEFYGVFDKEDVIIEFNSQGKCLEFGEFNDLVEEK